MKTCIKCQTNKPLTEFHSHPETRSGVQGKCKSCQSIYNAEMRNKNKKKYKEYYLKNKERIVKQTIKRDSQRKKVDEIFKFNNVVRVLIRDSFRRALKGKYKKGKKTENILGCSMEEFQTHLQNQFLKGMEFSNHGEIWEIDHITKLSSAQSKKQITELNHYTNLRPLFKTTKIAKSLGYNNIVGNRNRKKN